MPILYLEPDEQQAVLTRLSPPGAATLVADVPPEQATRLLEHLDPQAAATVVAELPSDEQADVIRGLPSTRAKAILQELEPSIAGRVRALAEYPEDVAGGLMVTEYVDVEAGSTVADAVKDLAEPAGDVRRYFYTLRVPSSRTAASSSASPRASSS